MNKLSKTNKSHVVFKNNDETQKMSMFHNDDRIPQSFFEDYEYDDAQTQNNVFEVWIKK